MTYQIYCDRGDGKLDRWGSENASFTTLRAATKAARELGAIYTDVDWVVCLVSDEVEGMRVKREGYPRLDHIVIEDFHVEGMQQNRRLARSLNDRLEKE